MSSCKKACNYRKVITWWLSMPKMCKLLSKGNVVLRIGYSILIIYIPILRFGKWQKVSTNGILHCAYYEK